MTVKQTQLLLAYLGYGLEADGISGQQTEAAVRRFQEEFGGLEADGIPGEKTWEALRRAVSEEWKRPETAKDGGSKAGAFWDEIRFFTREEFRCRCGNYHAPYCDGFPVEPEEKLVRLADRVRAHFGAPARPSSGIRCRRHNADQPNSAANSRHLYGKALDFRVDGVTAGELLEYIRQQPETNYAYAIDGRYVHMDVES